MSDTSPSAPDPSRATRKRAAQVVFVLLLQALVLFAAAGRLDWVAAWAHVGTYVAALVLVAQALRRANPGLAAVRAEAGPGVKARAISLSRPLNLGPIGSSMGLTT